MFMENGGGTVIAIHIFSKTERGCVKTARRETAVLIRLTDNEKKRLKQKAKKSNMSVSEYARAKLIHSDDESIRIIDTGPLRKAAHELAKQGTNLNQFMKFLNTYGVKVFDAAEARSVLEKEVETFGDVACALAALRAEAERNNVHLEEDMPDELGE